ncbi:MAG TPA: SCO family protein [Pyrinomonadaceae bacterium]
MLLDTYTRSRCPYPFVVAIFSIAALAAAFETPAQSAEKYFTNTELIDQSGRKLRFYDDVLKGKVVVINPFHTTCKSTVPVMNGNIQKIGDAFPANLSKNLFFVSITVDAETDTPSAINAYAKQVKAKPGWLFLTGTKDNVSIVLKKLGLYVEDKESHSTLLLIGNDSTGLWKKAFGLAKSDDLIPIVRSVLEDKEKR